MIEKTMFGLTPMGGRSISILLRTNWGLKSIGKQQYVNFL
jgi:hypothetical protein